MQPEVFIVSTIYWISIILILVWINRRISELKERIRKLEGEQKQ